MLLRDIAISAILRIGWLAVGFCGIKVDSKSSEIHKSIKSLVVYAKTLKTLILRNFI